MRTPPPRLAPILLVYTGVASCCQTTWFTVTRRASGPAPALALPQVLDGPIPIPLRLENRFLPHGSEVPRALAAYTDQIDPRADEIQELGAAIEGLEHLWALKGSRRRPTGMLAVRSPTPPQTGTVRCQFEGPTEICLAVDVLGVLAEQPAVAQITIVEGTTERRHVIGVMASESLEDAPVAGPSARGSTAAGTHVVLTRPIPRVADGDKVEVVFGSMVTLSRSFLTFVHASDTQLRDADVKLLDPVLSARMDHLVESFEHDEDQELYGPALAEAMVATINREGAVHRAEGRLADAPSFVIHTGDSIDAGTVRELEQFHAIMDRLSVPWFNVIGNHDVLVFGNFLPGDRERHRNCVDQTSIVIPYAKAIGKRWFLPGKLCIDPQIEGAVEKVDVFVAKDTHAASRASFIEHHAHDVARPLRVVPEGSDLLDAGDPCSKILLAGPHDDHHGFDLNPDMPGYYAFASKLSLGPEDVTGGVANQRRAIFIALDSEDLEPTEGGNSGRIQRAQYAWLARTLRCVRDRDLVFLFAHHSPGEIKTPSGVLRGDPMLDRPNVVGFFYGHHHQHGLCRAPGACTTYWEIESASLIEHPQEARLVRLKYVGAGLAFIETVAFTERLANPSGEHARRVELARRGADHDHCLRNRCSDDDRVRRQDGRFTSARLFFELP